jgi:hypothetical protein
VLKRVFGRANHAIFSVLGRKFIEIGLVLDLCQMMFLRMFPIIP